MLAGPAHKQLPQRQKSTGLPLAALPQRQPAGIGVCASRLSSYVWHQHGKLGPEAPDMDNILVRRSVVRRLTTQLGKKSQGHLQLLLEVWGAPLNHPKS